MVMKMKKASKLILIVGIILGIILITLGTIVLIFTISHYYSNNPNLNIGTYLYSYMFFPLLYFAGFLILVFAITFYIIVKVITKDEKKS